jgi:hypothetical protein
MGCRSELKAAVITACGRALKHALGLLISCEIERKMRNVHGKSDGVSRVETFNAALGVHTLDSLHHAGVLAVEELHALLHNVQWRNYGIVNYRRTSACKHIPKYFVAITAAFEGFLAELVGGKIQSVAGYRRRAHCSYTPIQRKQPLLRNRMPGGVRNIAVPAEG